MKKFLVVMLLCFLSIHGIYSQSDQVGLITLDPVSQSEQVNLNPNNVSSQSVQNQTSLEVDSTRSVELNENDEAIKFINIVIYVVLFISILLNIFLIFKYNSLYNRQKRKSHNKNEDKYYSELSNVNLNLQKEINLLKTKISSLNMENNKQIETQISKEIFIEDVKATTIELEVKNEKNSSNIIFLPSPFEERRFSYEDTSATQEQGSLYKIEYNPKNNRGNINLIETADLSRALNSPNAYLETVCEYQNAFSTNAKGIKVVSNGEVVLDDKDWVVTKKIKIKFI